MFRYFYWSDPPSLLDALHEIHSTTPKKHSRSRQTAWVMGTDELQVVTLWFFMFHALRSKSLREGIIPMLREDDLKNGDILTTCWKTDLVEMGILRWKIEKAWGEMKHVERFYGFKTKANPMTKLSNDPPPPSTPGHFKSATTFLSVWWVYWGELAAKRKPLSVVKSIN